MNLLAEDVSVSRIWAKLILCFRVSARNNNAFSGLGINFSGIETYTTNFEEITGQISRQNVRFWRKTFKPNRLFLYYKSKIACFNDEKSHSCQVNKMPSQFKYLLKYDPTMASFRPEEGNWLTCFSLHKQNPLLCYGFDCFSDFTNRKKLFQGKWLKTHSGPTQFCDKLQLNKLRLDSFEAHKIWISHGAADKIYLKNKNLKWKNETGCRGLAICIYNRLARILKNISTIRYKRSSQYLPVLATSNPSNVWLHQFLQFYLESIAFFKTSSDIFDWPKHVHIYFKSSITWNHSSFWKTEGQQIFRWPLSYNCKQNSQEKRETLSKVSLLSFDCFFRAWCTDETSLAKSFFRIQPP